MKRQISGLPGPLRHTNEGCLGQVQQEDDNNGNHLHPGVKFINIF